MAFLNQKGGRHVTLMNHLLDWLGEQLKTPKEFEKFMEEMMQADSRRYQQVTSEAFAWLRWLRQMAPARANGGER
jgi:CRISPR-associated protein Cmr5